MGIRVVAVLLFASKATTNFFLKKKPDDFTKLHFFQIFGTL